MVGVTGLGPLSDAFAFLAAGTSLGFFVRHVLSGQIAPPPTGPPNPDGLLEEIEKLKKDLASALDQLAEIAPQLEDLNKLRTALKGDEDELWRLHAVEIPEEVASRLSENRPKIITVINLKGGVGKTTTVANLAAHFGRQGRRVLTIDLDYQGSLSRMLTLAGKIRGIAEPRNIDLLSSSLEASKLRQQVISLHPTIENVDLVSSGQPFDRFENRLMLSWLIGDEADDIRYRLARVLTSDPFREAYDLILIDAPPRLSTGAINALATSHAILIPTVLDRLSAEAIGNFINRLNHICVLNRSLHYAGVIGTLRGQMGGWDVIKGARKIAEEGLARWHGRHHVFDNDIRYFTPLAREAGSNIGYLRHVQVREAYTALAIEIEAKLPL